MENFNSTFVAELVTHLADNAIGELSVPSAHLLCFHEISTILCCTTEPGRQNAIEKVLKGDNRVDYLIRAI